MSIHKYTYLIAYGVIIALALVAYSLTPAKASVPQHYTPITYNPKQHFRVPDALPPLKTVTPKVTPKPVVATPPPAPAPPPAPMFGTNINYIPGVPSSFVTCVAYRESTDLQNPAANGNAYGIIPASGYNVAGMSLAGQQQIFAQLYAQYGGSPWAADGCPGT